MTGPDYGALAAQAARDHREANERFQKAKTDSEMASFRQVVFACAAAGVTKINLEPSDQGDHMSLLDVEPEELHDNDLDNELWDGVSDLSDYTSSDWGGQSGVEIEISHRDDQITSATIDIKVAAEALLRPRCDRHGGTWGDDKTCARCTYENGTARPIDQPGPLGPGATA